MTRLLAIDGGTPLRSTAFPPWPAPGEAEVAAVAEVVSSARLTYWTGDHGRALEREYADSLGRSHGIAVANGTLALELGLRAFDIGPGDDVVVPARTFIATASAVVSVGARPVVADIDPSTNVITAQTAAAVLTERTRALIPVHLGGWPVELDPLMALANEHGLVVIEDCAQAHGATYRDAPVGGPRTHAAAFSFCQDKIVSAGEGGMLLLDDEVAYQRAWGYKDHGKSLERVTRAASDRDTTAFRWLVEEFGSNWRMAEMSAVLARIGLTRLPEWRAARTRNALRLAGGIGDLPGLQVPLPPPHASHAFYRLYAAVDATALSPGWDRDRVARSIAAEGVPCQYGTCAEIYREAAFERAGLGPAERLPGAAAAHESSLAFLVHPTLTSRDIDDTVAAVVSVMEAATS